MKQLTLAIVVLSIILTACTKQNGTTTVPGTGMVDTTTALFRYSGSFSNGPYGTVSGQAKIYAEGGNHTLKLGNVSISNGPDLHVYLSREIISVNYIDLGRLQSTSGNQVYPITGSPDFTQYKYVLVHCQRFNHLFGSAELR
jgi:hypothetical protein